VRQGRAVPQRTIRRTAALEGIGVHTGARVRVRIAGAPPGAGIVFSRRDVPEGAAVRAAVEAVRSTQRGVTLGNGVTVVSVEHLMAATWRRWKRRASWSRKGRRG